MTRLVVKYFLEAKILLSPITGTYAYNFNQNLQFSISKNLKENAM